MKSHPYIFIYLCIYVHLFWQSMELHWQLLTFIVCLQLLHSAGFIIQSEVRKCTYGHIDKLLRIRCYDLDLKEVPQNLKSSVEVSNDRGVRRSDLVIAGALVTVSLN